MCLFSVLLFDQNNRGVRSRLGQMENQNKPQRHRSRQSLSWNSSTEVLNDTFNVSPHFGSDSRVLLLHSMSHRRTLGCCLPVRTVSEFPVDRRGSPELVLHKNLSFVFVI